MSLYVLDIDRRNSTMSRAPTPAPPLAIDVAVVLTAIVRPEPDAGGYSASIPALPGCHTQGETLDEVRANLREAAEGWLAVAHEDGLARETAEGAS
jgi:predicted RNase H-like HicB family nuclease